MRCVSNEDYDSSVRDECLNCLRACASRGSSLDTKLWMDLIRSSAFMVTVRKSLGNISRRRSDGSFFEFTRAASSTLNISFSSSSVFEMCTGKASLVMAWGKVHVKTSRHLRHVTTNDEMIWRHALTTTRGTITLTRETPSRHNIPTFQHDIYSTIQMIHSGLRSALREIERRNLTTQNSDLVVNESLVWLISLLQTIEDVNTVRSVVRKIKSRVVKLYVLESCALDIEFQESASPSLGFNLETLLERRISVRKTESYVKRPFETLVEIDRSLTKSLPSHVQVPAAIFHSEVKMSEYNEDYVTDLCRFYKVRDDKDVKTIGEILRNVNVPQHKFRTRLEHAEYLNTSEYVERVLRDLCPELWGALRVGQCSILHITSIWWRRRFCGLLPQRIVTLFSILCRYAPRLCHLHFTLTALFHLKASIFESASGISDVPLCVLIQRPLPLKDGMFWIRIVDEAVLLFMNELS